MTLGTLIREQRKRMGMTQVGLSEYMDCTQGTVQKWEAGDVTPRAASLLQLSALFGVPPEEMLRLAALGQSTGKAVK